MITAMTRRTWIKPLAWNAKSPKAHPINRMIKIVSKHTDLLIFFVFSPFLGLPLSEGAQDWENLLNIMQFSCQNLFRVLRLSGN